MKWATVLYAIISAAVIAVCCIYLNCGTFNENNTVLEIYSYTYTFGGNEAYYIGIDKNRHIYVRGSNKSESLIKLWYTGQSAVSKAGIDTVAYYPDENDPYLGVENTYARDFIPKALYTCNDRLSEEEYNYVLAQMDVINENYPFEKTFETVFNQRVFDFNYYKIYKYGDNFYQMECFYPMDEYSMKNYGVEFITAVKNLEDMFGKYIPWEPDPLNPDNR